MNHHENGIFRLGTRRSPLAMAQSQWVCEEVRRKHPKVQIELVGIETQGDRIVDIPLRNVEGKDFFVAELDRALTEGRVDFAVHSMKDLSLQRPPELVCAAIPKRANPRDVVLFGPHILEKLRLGEVIRIGTSAPRRLENVPSFLEKALPQLGPAPQLRMLEIRGNVNTRVGRLFESLDSDRHLDGVVLALAGLARLSEASHELRSQLTSGKIRWMVLPLRECPSAPAQGALAVECRRPGFQTNDLERDQRIYSVLSSLHDSETENRVKRERKILEKWGGGCHQKLGAVATFHPELGDLLFTAGRTPEGKRLEDLTWTRPEEGHARRIWDGHAVRVFEEQSLELDSSQQERLQSARSLFVAHSRALPKERAHLISRSRIWTSGTSSWFRLAGLGLWIEGCAEGFGFDWIQDLLQEKVFDLPELKEWKVLTHDQAGQDWGALGMEVIATYRLKPQDQLKELVQDLRMADLAFWMSGSQFEACRPWIHPQTRHACGPGRTAEYLREKGIRPLVFPSREEWEKWKKNG